MILGDEVKFLNPCSVELLRLVYNILDGTAAKLSSDEGNCAVGTAVVTTLRNLKISGVRCGSENSAAAEGRCVLVLEGRVLFASHYSATSLAYVIKTTYANNGVKLRQLLHNLLAVSLYKTTGSDYVLTLAPLLKLCRVENVVDSLLLCALDKAAGVDNYDFSLFRLKGDLKLYISDSWSPGS